MSNLIMNNPILSTQMKRKLYHFFDILLRVPPLFIIDSIILCEMRITNVQYLFDLITNLSNNTNNLNSSNNSNNNINKTNVYKQIFTNEQHDEQLTIFNDNNNYYYESDQLNSLQTLINNTSALIMIIALLTSLTLCILPTEYLFQFYKWLLSIVTAFISYILNDNYVKNVFNENHNGKNNEFLNIYDQPLSIVTLLNGSHFVFLYNYICQMILAILFVYLTGIQKSIIPFVAAFFFILPYYAYILRYFISNKYLLYFPTITLIISLIYILITLIYDLQNIVQALYSKFIWIKSYMRDLGLFALIESEWNRLHVPQVFRVFFIARVAHQATQLFIEKNQNNDSEYSLILNGTVILENSKYLMIRGCETIIAVLGMTSVLSGITNRIGCLMQSFLSLDDPDDRSIGTISAIMFFILALQNGLTSMEPEKRFLRLYRNFCLLFTAMLHFIHNMVSPLLFSLSASRNMSIQRHLRALTVCSSLIILPYLFLNYLWTHHTISTWLLAVSAFGIEAIVKVIITLLIYTIFMIDAFRTSMWEQLDDYVYYVRTVGNLIEFVFGIFLFLNGTWILIFESGGTIRALMMCIHAYFNIWCQAIAGLKTFFKRYQALRKINSLPEASPEQLQRFDDVCSICYQELTTARITKCNHYFHSVCLRKWLYLQDICPLCHKTLYV